MANKDLENLKQLREVTGAGLVDARAALAAAGGDVNRAVANLRRNGLAPNLGPSPADALDEDALKVFRRGYRFDTWSRELSRAVVRHLRGQAQQRNLQSVRIELGDLDRWPLQVTTDFDSGFVQFEPYGDWDHAEFPVPDNSDETDYVLLVFAEDNALFDHSLSLADYQQLPGALWYVAMAETAALVAKEIVDADDLTMENPDVAVDVHGSPVESEELSLLLQSAQAALQAEFSDSALLGRFAAVCYEEPARRQWLVDLRDTASIRLPF